jgi:signal transduction histidine kinase
MTRMITDRSLPDPGSRLPELKEALMSEDGLRHISRLVTIGELALCFSHEVKNPLSVVLGHAHMMRLSLPDDDPIRIQLDGIERHGLRIKGMTDSILNFGRKREKTKDRCAPEELIQEAVRFVGPYFMNFSAPAIVVKIDVECGCPAVAVDRWEMIHVLVNLLNNAADAMGGQSLQRLITLTAQRETQGTIRISVADTGSGIAPEDAGRVFTPFFSTKGERGNGLGLYIARSTVEEHGGTIAMQTGEGGTVFTICLPTC